MILHLRTHLSTQLNMHPSVVAASLLLALTSGLAFGAVNVASDSDISKAMNPFAPEIQKSLNEKAPGAPNSSSPGAAAASAQAELSPRCRRLLAEISTSKTGEPPPQHNTYPLERRRDGGYVAPSPATFSGSVNINSSNSVPGGIHYDRRARLEDQFQRECR